MNHLDHRSERVLMRAPIAAGLGNQQQQRRTQPLAAAGDDVIGYSADQRDVRVQRFAQDLALALLVHDRPAAAARLMEAEQAITPESSMACLLHMEARRARGDWPGARAAFERMAAATRASAIDTALVSSYADALERTGAQARARALRDSLARLARR